MQFDAEAIKELFLKYIAHVASCEGTAFTTSTYRNLSAVPFTDDEWRVIEQYEEESRKHD
jgi:hypothetical protein